MKFKNRSLTIGLGITGFLLISAVAAPLLAPYHPDQFVAPGSFAAPSLEHWFGGDHLGRDLFSRVLYGGRVSLGIAGVVVTLSLLLGGFYGSLAGLLGGWVDVLMMRLLDFMLSFPLLFLAVTFVAIWGNSIGGVIGVLAVTGWMDLARLVRAEVLALRQSFFLQRARASGLGTGYILIRELAPNLLTSLLPFLVLRTADIILVESSLGFLGLGVPAPLASWGSIISDGRAALSSAWWISFFPGLAIVLTIMGLYILAEGLREKRHAAVLLSFLPQRRQQ